MPKKLRHILPVIICLLCLSGCATTGPGGKKSVILLSTSQEVSIGQEMDAEIHKKDEILADSSWQAYINQLGQKVVSVCDRKDLKYHFTVIESDDINAFATPGGYVYIYTGLIKKMDTESELVSVLAHEISHIVARHSVKRLQSIMGLSIVLDLALGKKSDRTKEIVGAALGIVMSGYSRANEHEADEFGVIYMARAGWNPNGMVSMFEKLQTLEGNHQATPFEMLGASHPQTKDRIKATEKRISEYHLLSSGLVLDNPWFQRLKASLP